MKRRAALNLLPLYTIQPKCNDNSSFLLILYTSAPFILSGLRPERRGKRMTFFSFLVLGNFVLVSSFGLEEVSLKCKLLGSWSNRPHLPASVSYAEICISGSINLVTALVSFSSKRLLQHLNIPVFLLHGTERASSYRKLNSNSDPGKNRSSH